MELDKGTVTLRGAQSRSEESHLALALLSSLELQGWRAGEGLRWEQEAGQHPAESASPAQQQEEVESLLSPEIRNRQQLTRGSK